MPRVYLLRAEPRRVGRRIVESIDEPIPRAAVLGTFGGDEIASLRAVEGAAGGYFAWGLRDEEPVRSVWSEIEVGDWLIGSSEGRFRFTARLLERRRNAAFAERVWGMDPGGGARELLLFVTRPEPLAPHVEAALSSLSPSSVADLTALADEAQAPLVGHFASLSRFVEEGLRSEEEEAPWTGSGEGLHPALAGTGTDVGMPERGPAEVAAPVVADPTPLPALQESAPVLPPRVEAPEPEVAARAEVAPVPVAIPAIVSAPAVAPALPVVVGPPVIARTPFVAASAPPVRSKPVALDDDDEPHTPGIAALPPAPAPPAPRMPPRPPRISWLGRRAKRRPGAGVPVEAVDAILGPRPGADLERVPERAARVVRALALVRSLLASVTSLFVIVVLGFAWMRTVGADRIVIEPLSVPQALADAGYTPQVVARRLVDRVTLLHAAQERPEARGYERALPDLESPEAGSADAWLRLAADLAGASVPRVRGEVVQHPAGLALRLRLDEGTKVEAEVPVEAGLDALLDAGARRLVEASDPYLLALHLADADPDAALDALRLTLIRQPLSDDPFAHLLEARLLRVRGDADGALAALERAAASRPDLAAAHRERARLLGERKDPEGAAASWQAAAELDPEDAHLQLEWGRALEARGDLKGALERYQRAAELDPRSAKAHSAWAGVLVAQGDAKGAEAQYREATTLDPADPTPWNDWANALQRAGDADGAIEKLERATRIDPGYAVAYNNWGVALRARNDHDGAIEKYRKAVELDPSYAVAYNNWGVALRAKKDEAGAVERFRRATEIAPEYASPWNNWGLALQALNDARGAVDKFKRAAELVPGEAGIHYNWGLALSAHGDHQGALERYERALELDPQRFGFVKDRIARLRGSAPEENLGRR